MSKKSILQMSEEVKSLNGKLDRIQENSGKKFKFRDKFLNEIGILFDEESSKVVFSYTGHSFPDFRLNLENLAEFTKLLNEFNEFLNKKEH